MPDPFLLAPNTINNEPPRRVEPSTKQKLDEAIEVGAAFSRLLTAAIVGHGGALTVNRTEITEADRLLGDGYILTVEEVDEDILIFKMEKKKL